MGTSFEGKIIKDYIQGTIEDSWDRSDEGEYILPHERAWLVAEGAFEQWKDTYFEELVETYKGTCNSINPKDESFLEEFDMYRDFDDQIFECGTCGWWYDSSEEGESSNYERTCENCAEEELE